VCCAHAHDVLIQWMFWMLVLPSCKLQLLLPFVKHFGFIGYTISLYLYCTYVGLAWQLIVLSPMKYWQEKKLELFCHFIDYGTNWLWAALARLHFTPSSCVLHCNIHFTSWHGILVTFSVILYCFVFCLTHSQVT